MKKFLIILTTLVSLSLLVLPVFASDSVGVTATVTPEQIAVALYGSSPSSVNYGTLAYGAVDQVPQNNPYIELVNNGTVLEDFHIRGDDATTTIGSTWVLGSSPSHDQYVHKYGVGASPSTWHALTTSQVDNEWANDVPVGENRDFRLRIDTPTESSSYEEHTTTVTVIATAH